MNAMDDKVSILIIEDDGILALDLSDLLEEDGYCVVGIASNGRKALEFFNRHPVDLVLCDITIRGDWDGIRTAQELMALRPAPLIYLTALSDRETVERAKKTFPAAYLNKPVDETALRIAIELALNNFSQRQEAGPTRPEILSAGTPAATGMPTTGMPATDEGSIRREPLLKLGSALFVKQGYQFVKIDPEELVYLEAEGIYTTLVTRQRKYAVRLSLSSTIERLSDPRIVRTHRSYAVNLSRMDSFSDSEVLAGTHTIPLGRNYHDEFLRRFSTH